MHVIISYSFYTVKGTRCLMKNVTEKTSVRSVKGHTVLRTEYIPIKADMD